MQFLQTLAELATEKIQLSIAITIEDGNAVVTVTPKVANNNWSPFVMRGKAEELDGEFANKMETFKQALGIIANSETYLEQIKAEATTKQATTKKSPTPAPTTTAAKTATPAKKEEPKKEDVKKKEEVKKEEKKEEEEGLELFS